MKLLLCHPPLQATTNRLGVGFQVPFGLLCLGGPLVDDGFDVSLLDADLLSLRPDDIARHCARQRRDALLVGHTASTASFEVSMRVLRAVKHRAPEVFTIYGGVLPSFRSKQILQHNPCLDFIVRGEGEHSVTELLRALESGNPLSAVRGLSWRGPNGSIHVNPPRPPIDDLNALRIAWELVPDWSRYKVPGFPGNAATVQLSRGCPHHCTYCGQWSFWRSWRYRSPGRVIADMRALARDHGVRTFWLADENPTTCRNTWESFLRGLAQASEEFSIIASIRTADVCRDRDLLPLARRAGLRMVLLGVDALTDTGLDSVRKETTASESAEAVRLLRKDHILSIVDYMTDLPGDAISLRQALRKTLALNSDFLNVVFMSPHPWTAAARELDSDTWPSSSLRWWDYRHNVVQSRVRSARRAFVQAKLLEVLFHLSPVHLIRRVRPMTRRNLATFLTSMTRTTRVYFAEWLEFLRYGGLRRDFMWPPCSPAETDSMLPGAARTDGNQWGPPRALDRVG